MKKLLFHTLALLLALPGFAQIKTPAASPAAKVIQTVGLSEITVEYSRPSVKGRTIFAEDGLVPYGKLWRTGANAATKITFSDDVMLGADNFKLAAGEYAILTKPMAEVWHVMFYPYESSSWGSYVDKEAAATLKAEVNKTGHMVETFTIGFDKLTMDGAHLVFAWENTMVALPIRTEVHEAVMADIKRTMAGPTANDYFRAASYLHDSGQDLELALEYIQKATNVEEPRFWMVRREALILKDLGRSQEAIAAAKRSLELARAAGNEDYVRMNEKSIAEWTGKSQK
ncbi:MAG: DUF2911 domain-containing protein [Bacteroidetes bacterium]|nr:MAG: DUF2911 domain-containing protein [Bacteroidota bacterium]